MGITAFQMYLLLTLDNVVIFITIFGMLGVIISLVYLTSTYNNLLPYEWNIKRVLIMVIPIFLLIIATLLPTTKQMAAILVLPKIINNESIQEVPEQLWIEELKPDNTTNKG